ncbi:hypothetical protein LINPERPRIM_LOCUS14427, partial [Linum perenne]
ILSLVIVPPNLSEIPQIFNTLKFHLYFRDCVGAIDGLHIDVVIPTGQQTPFCGRKTTTTQNVMCVVSFEMLFTYVAVGWEGTTYNARI